MARKTPSDLDVALGKFLRAKMLKNDWSYPRLAKETGVPQSMLHGIVSGEKFATLHMLSRIMKSLKVGLPDIFPKKGK